MKRNASRRLVALLLPGLALALLWVGSSAAQSLAGPPPSTTAPQEVPALEPVVMETLKRMSDLLKVAKSFTFTYRVAREQVAQLGRSSTSCMSARWPSRAPTSCGLTSPDPSGTRFSDMTARS